MDEEDDTPEEPFQHVTAASPVDDLRVLDPDLDLDLDIPPDEVPVPEVQIEGPEKFLGVAFPCTMEEQQKLIRFE